LTVYTRCEKISGPTVAVLGFFDGMHVGHARLVERGAELARRLGARLLLHTFSSMPPTKGARGELTPLPLKAEIAASFGVEIIAADPFSDELRRTPPRDFLEQTVFGRLGAVGAVCGFDYRFGRNAGGGPELLRQVCAERGAVFAPVDKVTIDGVEVSSSYIRSLVAEGDMRAAARFMGRPYIIEEKVVRGRRLGREMGFATINQPLSDDMVRPRFGVYLSCALLDGGERYFGVTNVGVRPTVDGNEPMCETHLLGFSEGELYGRTVRLGLLEMLREERKFDGIAALSAQIGRDRASAAGLSEKYDKNQCGIYFNRGFTSDKLCDIIL